MNSFVNKYAQKIKGTLSGWDRIVLRGNILNLCYTEGILSFLLATNVLLKDFTQFAQEKTAKLLAAAELVAPSQDRPYTYLSSSSVRKDQLARDIARNDAVTSGIICSFGVVEPCRTIKIVPNREIHKLQPRIVDGKCKHLYTYWFDEKFGFMSARVQTWFPFQVQFHLNGREYLARQMDVKALEYIRDGNCFTDLGNVAKTQRLFNRMNDIDWCKECDRFRKIVFPNFGTLFRGAGLSYYWTAHQTEWATDVMFDSDEGLKAIYPQLCRGAIEAFDAKDVMRFLGRQRNFTDPAGEVTSDYGSRVEGIRLKHRSLGNSVKMYDKAGSVLRIETTINNVEPFKSYRSAQGDEESSLQWRAMRKGVADMERRGEVSQESNDRYMEALSSLDTEEDVKSLLSEVCNGIKRQGKTYRGLNAFGEEDLKLITAVSSGKFVVNGFRNREIAEELYGKVEESEVRRKHCSKVSYRLRLLRKHGLIRKVPNERRYHVSAKGRKILSALLQLQSATIQASNALAA